MRRQAIVLVLLGLAAITAHADGTEPIAYVTEIQDPARGAAVVLRTTAEGKPVPVQPLMTLRQGDELRITGETRLVILYHVGSGTRTLTRTDSPFRVVSAPAGRGNDRLRVLVATAGQIFANQRLLAPARHLAVRSPDASPPTVRLVSPRGTRILPGVVTFEWAGDPRARYSIRVIGPRGLTWEAREIALQPLTYPATAPRLEAGAEYEWEVSSRGQQPRTATFRVASPEQSQRVDQALQTLKGAASAGYSSGTVPSMCAALLIDEGLYADARRELLAAIAARPQEPAYHVLLAEIYRRVGLDDEAGESTGRARLLAGLKPAG